MILNKKKERKTKMLKLKKAIELGIESGMTEFQVVHHNYNGRVFTFPSEEAMTVFDAYLDDDVLSVNFGTAYSSLNKKNERVYHKPTTCYIIIKSTDETLRTE